MMYLWLEIKHQSRRLLLNRFELDVTQLLPCYNENTCQALTEDRVQDSTHSCTERMTPVEMYDKETYWTQSSFYQILISMQSFLRYDLHFVP